MLSLALGATTVLAFGVIGAVTVAFAGGDLLLDALRRAMARLRSRKERRR